MALRWNPNYEFASAITLIVLMISYHMQDRLPLRKSRAFQKLMVCTFFMTILDLITSVTASYASYFPYVPNCILNSLYYIIVAGTLFLSVEYTAAVTHLSPKQPFIIRALFILPLLVTAVISLSSFATGWMFRIHNGVFYFGKYYYHVSIFFTVVYLLEMLFLIIWRFKTLDMKSLISLFAFMGFVVIGMTVQIFMLSDSLIYGGCCTLGVIVLFSSLQNPEALRDGKTKCYNLAAAGSIIDESGESGKTLAVTAIAFSNYSSVRSIYGDNNLDRLLLMITNYFMKSMRGYAEVFYIHAGRFLFISKDEKLKDILEDILNGRFHKPWEFDGDSVLFDPVMVILRSCDGSIPSGDIFDAVNIALDDEIEMGNAFTSAYVTDDDFKRMESDRHIQMVLSDSILNNSVEVYYQPIFDTKKHSFTAAEALARLRDSKTGEVIFPDAFISRSESDGSIIRLGMQVYEKTCKFLHENDMKSLGLEYIEVNLSPKQCIRESLPDELMMSAKKFNVNMNAINMEITESLSENMGKLKNLMVTMNDAGSSFSLDDYGTGFSNLTNILELPFSIVKIDKSIVWDYFNGKRDFLTNVIKMFKGSRLKIVCEGVETKEMAERLADMGVDFEQGYYFSKPIPEEKFLEFMKEHQNMNIA